MSQRQGYNPLDFFNFRESEFKDNRLAILEKLKALSEPQNEYQIEIPELDDEVELKEIGPDGEDIRKMNKQVIKT